MRVFSGLRFRGLGFRLRAFDTKNRVSGPFLNKQQEIGFGAFDKKNRVLVHIPLQML